MTAAAPLIREREIADLVRDLDQVVELLQDTPPDLSGFTRLGSRDRDAILCALMHAADFLHELRGATP